MFTNSEKRNEDREIQNRLAKVMYLDYVACFGAQNKSIVLPHYFRDELGIDDKNSCEKKALKNDYAFRNKNGYLELTEKGNAFLKHNTDYVRFFELAIPYITIEGYQRRKDNMDAGCRFEAVIISMLREKIKEAEQKRRFQRAANLYHEMGKQYESMSRSDQAMENYLTSMYIQVSGYEYADVVERRAGGQNTQRAALAAYKGTYLDPHLIRSIEKIGYAYDGQTVDKIYKRGVPKAHLCSREDFKKFAVDITCGMMDFEKWWGHFHTKYNECIEQASIR